LQGCEIELIKIVTGFLLYGGRELFLLPGKIALRTREPACDDMISCAVPIVRRNPVERLARQIEFSKTQRRGSEIELAVRVFREQSRYLLAPPDGLFEVLLFCCLCQNVLDVRICTDGLMYCEACRTACDYKTSD